MQRNAMTDTRIILIDGFRLPGLLTIGETGIQEDPVEVQENGWVRLIGSGVKKIKQVDFTYLIKRDSVVLKYIFEWKESGGMARDVTMYHSDKTGDITSAYRRTSLGDCELGSVTNPSFDEGSRQKSILQFSVFPYTYETRSII
jgi:hypothetical protein